MPFTSSNSLNIKQRGNIHIMSRTTPAILIGLLMLALASSAAANVNRTELLKAADVKESGKYVRTRFLQMMQKPFDAEGKKKALIIGDSHAQDFLNGVLENSYLLDYQISTRYIPVRCQISLNADKAKFIKAKDKNFCAKADSLQQAKNQIAEADLVILVADWKEWAAKQLPKSINALGLTPEQKLFVIGRKSFGKVSIRDYLRLPDEQLLQLRNRTDDQQLKIDKIMSISLSNSVFINHHKLVCGVSEDCPVFTSDLKLISFDGGHLTRDGASYIGKVLFENSALGNL